MLANNYAIKSFDRADLMSSQDSNQRAIIAQMDSYDVRELKKNQIAYREDTDPSEGHPDHLPP